MLPFTLFTKLVNREDHSVALRAYLLFPGVKISPGENLKEVHVGGLFELVPFPAERRL